MDVSVLLGTALGYLLAQLVRHFSRSRFWSSVARGADGMLDDPTVPIDDPRKAAERALLDAQRPQVDEIVRSISPRKRDTSYHVQYRRAPTKKEDDK